MNSDKQKVQIHFHKVDAKMAELVTSFVIQNLPQERQSEEYFGRLCDDIISQQLSLKAAATIGKRFTDFFEIAQPGDLLPQKVNRATQAELRALGLSNAKANYVLGLAEAVVQNKSYASLALWRWQDQGTITVSSQTT